MKDIGDWQPILECAQGVPVISRYAMYVTYARARARALDRDIDRISSGARYAVHVGGEFKGEVPCVYGLIRWYDCTCTVTSLILYHPCTWNRIEKVIFTVFWEQFWRL